MYPCAYVIHGAGLALGKHSRTDGKDSALYVGGVTNRLPACLAAKNFFLFSILSYFPIPHPHPHSPWLLIANNVLGNPKAN